LPCEQWAAKCTRRAISEVHKKSGQRVDTESGIYMGRRYRDTGLQHDFDAVQWPVNKRASGTRVNCDSHASNVSSCWVQHGNADGIHRQPPCVICTAILRLNLQPSPPQSPCDHRQSFADSSESVKRREHNVLTEGGRADPKVLKGNWFTDAVIVLEVIPLTPPAKRIEPHPGSWVSPATSTCGTPRSSET
jgi:hypothetical protein